MTSIQLASNLRKITSLSSWMEVWYIYLSIVVDHTPARAAEFVAYQCIITSASIQYCPFHPNHLLTIPGGQRAITRGQPNSGSHMPPYPNQQMPFTCRDFNRNTCLHPDCKFAHCCKHCEANHAGKNCRRHGWPPHTP